MEDLGRKTQAPEEAKALALDLNYSSAQEELSMVWRDLNSNMRKQLKELRKAFKQ